MKIQNFIPDAGKNLTSYKGTELIDRIGESTVKEVVFNVLCGANIRTLTEKLTRKTYCFIQCGIISNIYECGSLN